MNWRESAAAVRWKIEPFIDGRYRCSSGEAMVDNINPAMETSLCRFSAGAGEDVDEAVRVARRRFEDGSWSQQAPGARATILLKWADLIVKNKNELALLDCLEMGKPIQAAIHDATTFAPSFLHAAASFADKLLGASAPLSSGAVAFNTYEPRGVVGAITPWNFPLVNAVIKVAPALAAGNSVVLKPSELAPSSALKFAELALEAGVPEGVLNVVPGLGDTVGAALASHPDIDLLSFTGSTQTGRRIMELAGRSNGKPLLLECGGKCPQVVFDDVDHLDRLADAVVQSAFWNQGQVCSARTRLLVQQKIKEALLEKVVERASRYRPDDPLKDATKFGALASSGQRVRVKRYVEEGLRDGAIAALRGEIQERGGCYVAPTIFDRTDASMSIVRDEIFGPVLCVQTFETEAEAITLANATDYGLAATVWTRDLARGRRLAHAIKAGGVAIRTSGEESGASGCILAHEPRKASGFGSEFGLRGLESYSTLKTVSFSGS